MSLWRQLKNVKVSLNSVTFKTFAGYNPATAILTTIFISVPLAVILTLVAAFPIRYLRWRLLAVLAEEDDSMKIMWIKMLV